MKFYVRILAGCLMISVFLTGCSSPAPAVSSQAGSSGSSSSAPAGSGEQSKKTETTDFSKYNTYLELLEYLYETSSTLDAYFTVVEYQDEFQLIEGQDYDNMALYSALTFGHTGILRLEDVLALTEEEPHYEELDAIVKGAVSDVTEIEAVLDEIQEYISEDIWEGDSYAGAANLHTKLMATIDPFYLSLLAMDECISEMEEELNAETLERMSQDGEMIGYYTILAIQQAEKVVDLAFADENFAGEELYIQNLEELTAACEELKGTAAQLMEALGDKEQRSKVPYISYTKEEDSDTKYRRYSNFVFTVESMNTRVDDLLAAAGQGEDAAFKAELVSSEYSDLVDCYNSYVAG